MNKKIIQALALKNFSEAKELVFKSLYAKSALALDEARLEVANGVFNNAEEETEETEEIEESKDGYFTNAKSRKAHVDKFYARKAKEKASRSPSEIEKDAKTDAYRAAYTKRTGKRVGRID